MQQVEEEGAVVEFALGGECDGAGAEGREDDAVEVGWVGEGELGGGGAEGAGEVEV